LAATDMPAVELPVVLPSVRVDAPVAGCDNSDSTDPDAISP